MRIKAKYYMLDAVNKSNLLKPVKGDEAMHLKRVLTMMLDDFQRRCENNHITPFLVYGSALGAFRHKGFIPWDDDVDVAMTREDWEKLKVIFKDAFSDKYELEGPNYNNVDSSTAWGKVFLKGTKYVELMNMSTPYNKGIFIDVFIIDGLSDNAIVRKADYFVARIARFIGNSMPYYQYPSTLMAEVMSVSVQTRSYLLFRRTIGFLFAWVSHKKWLSIYDKFVSRHRHSKCSIMNYDDAITERSYWFPVKKVPFENIMANIPNDIEGYLEMAFGKSYMQLPPEGEREQHFCVELDFGDYR